MRSGALAPLFPVGKKVDSDAHTGSNLRIARPQATISDAYHGRRPLATDGFQDRASRQGQVGAIVVRGGLVMAGYYRNEAATREASTFGWHHTGDIGVIDEDGFVYIVDRKKDMIISGGFNVFPSEVEQVLWSHPAVQDCAVIGVPDEKWGEAVKAVVELKPGGTWHSTTRIALSFRLALTSSISLRTGARSLWAWSLVGTSMAI